MQFNVCEFCKLSLPNNYLIPIILQNQQGQKKKGYICNNCKEKHDAQMKGKNNVK